RRKTVKLRVWHVRSRIVDKVVGALDSSGPAVNLDVGFADKAAAALCSCDGKNAVGGNERAPVEFHHQVGNAVLICVVERRRPIEGRLTVQPDAARVDIDCRSVGQLDPDGEVLLGSTALKVANDLFVLDDIRISPYCRGIAGLVCVADARQAEDDET